MTTPLSAAAEIEIVFNGPALAGIGATTDAGLTPERHHVLPWSVGERVRVNITENNGQIEYEVPSGVAKRNITMINALKTAIYNVDTVFAFEDTIGSVTAMTSDERTIFHRDLVSIIFLMTAYGYYDQECRAATKKEMEELSGITVPDSLRSSVINTESIGRAATFILARMHTKYQTNHVLGGSPMQASMASAVRAYYNVSPGVSRDNASQAKLKAYATGLHWALHPANERLLIPAVIEGSRITSATVHKDGPPITALGKEEYFAIRANTPPASTHHFYVAAAAVQHLEPLGILPYLPSIAQMKDIQTGWLLIRTHGARLHPAARYWGLERMSANQKLVEPVCADLGYAVRKLMPGSSLAASPLLSKEDSLNPQWKTFVDSIRAMMDAHGKELLDDKVLEEIKKSVAPTAKDNKGILAVKRLLITHTAPSGAAQKRDDQDDDQPPPPAADDGEDGDSSDDEDDAPPPAPAPPSTPPKTSTPPKQSPPQARSPTASDKSFRGEDPTPTPSASRPYVPPHERSTAQPQHGKGKSPQS